VVSGGTLGLARDEPPDTGLLGWLVDVERLNERIALVVAHNRCERPPDVIPLRVVWLVIKVVVNSLFQVAVLGPYWDGFVRAGRRPVVAVVVVITGHASRPSPTAGIGSSYRSNL
jgi:hypothetical protein